MENTQLNNKQMSCPRCRLALSRHDNFCSKCGSYYSESALDSAPAPTASALDCPSPASSVETTTKHSEGGRLMVGGAGITALGVVLHMAHITYIAYQGGAESAARQAHEAQGSPFLTPSNTTGAPAQDQSLPNPGFAQSEMQNQLQAQQRREQAQIQQCLQAQSAAMRSINPPPTFHGPNFGAAGPMGGPLFRGRP
jgi:hypothetical protein